MQVMEISLRMLGFEYFSMLNSINYFAFIFWSLDLKNEVIELMSEVVEHGQKKIGSNYLHIIQSIFTLLDWQNKVLRKSPDKKPPRRVRFPRQIPISPG